MWSYIIWLACIHIFVHTYTHTNTHVHTQIHRQHTQIHRQHTAQTDTYANTHIHALHARTHIHIYTVYYYSNQCLFQWKMIQLKWRWIPHQAALTSMRSHGNHPSKRFPFWSASFTMTAPVSHWQWLIRTHASTDAVCCWDTPARKRKEEIEGLLSLDNSVCD